MIENTNFDIKVKVESPGRINLIGEHVDYSVGYVFPAAIDKKITLRFRKKYSRVSSIFSKNLNSQFEIN